MMEAQKTTKLWYFGKIAAEALKTTTTTVFIAILQVRLR